MPYKAIVVKYLPWTETKPARYKAFTEGKSCIASMSDYDDADEAQAAAAIKLGTSLHWSGIYVKGTLPNGHAVFVVADPFDKYGRITL